MIALCLCEPNNVYSVYVVYLIIEIGVSNCIILVTIQRCVIIVQCSLIILFIMITRFKGGSLFKGASSEAQ